MKNFRKNKEGFYICEECNKTFNSIISLSHHIATHCDNKFYFDKWIKDKNDGKCKICSNQTNYLGWNRGYSATCCVICEDIKRKNTFMEKYDVDNPSKIKEVQDKRIKTYSNHINEINLKRNKTYKSRFNSHPLANKKVKEKILNTNKLKYGCEYPIQNSTILEKAQKSAFKLKQFNDKVWYQGTYELDFLEKYYTKYPDIQRGPSIKYSFNGKNKVYHPDFFIPSLNLIVEIKNSHLAKRDKELIEEKKKATIANGFNYIIIIDKIYQNNDFA